ncbi:FeoB small GTPase domain-containing protein [Flintibacter muris]|uniref:FeoB small GTPase domain-containing protein n=1 Tax=Flintibacter muris TaxID=2941327 RepID=UPI003B9756B5
MDIKITLSGNPNCSKTTLLNTLTGSSQCVGNWSGVTVEKLERPKEELESWSPRIVNVIEKDYAAGYLRKTPITRLFNWTMRTFHMGFMLHIEFRE